MSSKISSINLGSTTGTTSASFNRIQPDIGDTITAGSSTDTLTVTSSTIDITGTQIGRILGLEIKPGSGNQVLSTDTTGTVTEWRTINPIAGDITANYAAGTITLALNSPIAAVTALVITATTAFRGPVGALSSTPSYSFTGDVNNGWYSPSADAQTWATGGTDRLHLDSGGRLTLGASAATNTSFEITRNSGSAQRAAVRITSSTTTQGGLSFYHTPYTNPFSTSSVNGFTGDAIGTNNYGHIRISGSTTGGLLIIGNSNTAGGTAGVYIGGAQGTNGTTVGAICLEGCGLSGGAAAAIASASHVLTMRNNGTSYFILHGNGSMTLGNSSVSDATHIVDAGLAYTPDVVSVTADNQAVATTYSLLSISGSGGAAPGDRTFTLTAGAVGQWLTIVSTGGFLELADSGNAKLSAAWQPGADDTITLVCDGTNWIEVCRSDN